MGPKGGQEGYEKSRPPPPPGHHSQTVQPVASGEECKMSLSGGSETVVINKTQDAVQSGNWHKASDDHICQTTRHMPQDRYGLTTTVRTWSITYSNYSGCTNTQYEQCRRQHVCSEAFKLLLRTAGAEGKPMYNTAE